MFSLTRNFLKFTAAGAIVALTAVSTPASADEMVQNLGPVPAHEPILKTVGNKHVIAFFESFREPVCPSLAGRGIGLPWP